MGVADETDRTLFVGNLDPKVTEELLFELFLQAGPLYKVKIPKDNDGKQKAFGFVCFKHEDSTPYAMNLHNGASLFGKTLKIQFRAGSSHINNAQNSQNKIPANTPNPHAPQHIQRSFSSPDSLQRQALMNNMWQLQMQQLHQLQAASGGIPAGGNGLLGHPLQSQRGGGLCPQDSSSQRGNSSSYYSRDQHYSGGSDDTGSSRHHRSQRGEHYHHDNRSDSGRSRDERWRDGSRDSRWRR
ncbi:hypothetical protein DPEC_G00369430 [Dallia pectoralis]|nr:hypothetical protein DPEC_G00369430 [Dallia pectoralis]